MSPTSQKENSKISSCIVFDISKDDLSWYIPWWTCTLLCPYLPSDWFPCSLVLHVSHMSVSRSVDQVLSANCLFAHFIWGLVKPTLRIRHDFFSFWSLLGGPKWEWRRSLEPCMLHRKEKQGEKKTFGFFIIAGVSRWQLKLNGLVLRIIYR